ncbi:MAG: hypothetical protein DPW16_06735 [Chloroflexi bacterium]|nr:hypothetical protein [Chloroflexota bacterium]
MRFLVCFCAIFLILANQSPIAEGQSNAPFFYYYSIEQAALIIERADASDSRILFHNPDEDGTGNIWGPGWSPSGNWFAWVNQSSGRTPPETNPVYVTRSDGQNQLSLLDNLGVVRLVEWSPVSDMLVVGLLTLPDDEYFIDVYVIDVGTQSVVNTYSLRELDFGGVNWTPGGEFLVLYQYPPYTPNLWNEVLPTAILLTLTGKQKAISISVPIDCFDFDSKAAFSNSSMVYRLKDSIIIRNLRTSEEKAINFPDQVIHSIEWSFDESYALIYSQESCESVKTRLWLLSAQTANATLVSQNVALPFYLDGVQHWNWSPSENIALFSSDEGFFLLIASQSAVQKIMSFSEALQSFHTPAQWLPDGSGPLLLNEIPSQTTGLSKFDLVTNELLALGSPRGLEISAVRNFVISPNSQYIAFSGTCRDSINSICFLDLHTNSLFLSSIYQSGGHDIAEIYWHPSQDWALIAEWVSISMRRISLSKHDGTSARKLGLCNVSESCFGWMPR